MNVVTFQLQSAYHNITMIVIVTVLQHVSCAVNWSMPDVYLQVLVTRVYYCQRQQLTLLLTLPSPFEEATLKRVNGILLKICYFGLQERVIMR